MHTHTRRWGRHILRLSLPALAALALLNAGSGNTAPAANAATFPSTNGKIVFDRENATGAGDIFTMNADGTGLKQLTTTAANEGDPVFSPDGTKIVFVSDRDGNDEIYIMNADGTQQVRRTNNPTLDGGPTWQPLP